MDTNFENPSINMNANGSGITKKDIEEVFSSANSALEEINASLNKIADILAKGLETKKEVVEEKEIINEEPIVNEEITNELPTLEVTNETIMPEIEGSNNIEVPTEEPVINNDEIQIQNTEPVIEETNTNDSVISIGDLLAQESAKEELPKIEVPTPKIENETAEVQVQNTEPVVETPVVPVQEQVTSPVVETTENVSIPEINVPQSNVPTMPVNNTTESTPSIDTQVPTNEAVAPVVEPQNDGNNVVVLDTVVTDAIGDGKQRSIITNENEHKNLLGKEKALTMSMSMGQAA